MPLFDKILEYKLDLAVSRARLTQQISHRLTKQQQIRE